ncbi:MAG: hypothetical protein ACI906_005178 [Candidatus Latescibacterota bacterium]|jgi:hypothetical protein
MLQRLKNRFKFHVERMLLRGAHYRLLFIAALIGLISAGGGLLALEIDGGFSGPMEAVWWAFLRLTDPGYLGDDEGLARRIISTAVTVLGYVVFMGALIAIMNQWFGQTMRRLESGLTPIVQSDHVLILGWTNRTASIVEELLLASPERLQRFLQRHGVRRLNIVILAEEVDAALVQGLRDFLGEQWDSKRIIFRTGTSLDIDHLHRVDFRNAAAIILPGGDFVSGGALAADARTIKTLLSIGKHIPSEERTDYPLLVTEIFDEQKILLAARAYQGVVEVLGSDLFISRLIAQNVRHPGLSHVLNEILSGTGNGVFIRSGASLVGMRFQDLAPAFIRAIPIGVLRPETDGGYETVLNPADGFTVGVGDRLILVTKSVNDGTSVENFIPEPLEREKECGEVEQKTVTKRLLILGWNHKAPVLLREFDSYDDAFEIDVLSSFSISQRKSPHLNTIQVEHHEDDFTVPSDLARFHPESFDHLVLLGSDRQESGEEADARTILGHLLLQDLVSENGPSILVELLDPKNTELCVGGRTEILVSPQVISHMLAQVALRPELRRVFDELFGPSSTEINFRSASLYELTGERVSFGQIQKKVAQRGEIALGIRLRDESDVYLNPDRVREWGLTVADEIVVLTTYGMAVNGSV